MDKFTKAEIDNRPYAIKVLREWLEQNPKKDEWEIVETPPEDKTRYDIEVISNKNNTTILVEHKHRFYESGTEWDWQVDGNKIIHLKGLYHTFSKFTGRKIVGCIYINTYTDGVGRMWDMYKNGVGYVQKSKPHKKYTVMDYHPTKNPMVVTEDFYLPNRTAFYATK